jgi:hypothetical protein
MYPSSEEIQSLNELNLFTLNTKAIVKEQVGLSYNLYQRQDLEVICTTKLTLTTIDIFQAFLKVIVPLMIDYWMELSLDVFGVGHITDTPALRVLSYIVTLLNLLFKEYTPAQDPLSTLTADELKWSLGIIKAIQKRIGNFFPFGQERYETFPQAVSKNRL